FLRSLPLEEHGLEWVHPDVMLAHPLDPGRAALLFRSVEETAAGLGPDADRYLATVGTVTEMWDDIEDASLVPFSRWKSCPQPLVRCRPKALLPATLTARRFRPDSAAAFFSGCAAHAFIPPDRSLTSAFCLTLMATSHRLGWPFAK